MIEKVLHLSHEIDKQLRPDELVSLQHRFQEKKPLLAQGFEPTTFRLASSGQRFVTLKSNTLFILVAGTRDRAEVSKTTTEVIGNIT